MENHSEKREQAIWRRHLQKKSHPSTCFPASLSFLFWVHWQAFGFLVYSTVPSLSANKAKWLDLLQILRFRLMYRHPYFIKEEATKDGNIVYRWFAITLNLDLVLELFKDLLNPGLSEDLSGFKSNMKWVRHPEFEMHLVLSPWIALIYFSTLLLYSMLPIKKPITSVGSMSPVLLPSRFTHLATIHPSGYGKSSTRRLLRVLSYLQSSYARTYFL